MPQLIKDRVLVVDAWALLRDAASLADLPENGSVIVPLALWLQRRDALFARGNVGVLLAPADDPAALVDDIATLPLIAVDFPQFTDGRGYSTARLLREKYGFKGELRAVGDVLRDQLYYLSASGFNAFALRADHDDRLFGTHREIEEIGRLLDAVRALHEHDGVDVRALNAHQIHAALSGDVDATVKLTLVRGEQIVRATLKRTEARTLIRHAPIAE